MSEWAQQVGTRMAALSARFWLVIFCFAATLMFVLFQGGKLAFMLFVIVSLICIYLLLGRWSGIGRTVGRRTLVGASNEEALEAGSSLTVRLDVHIPGMWPVPYVFIKDRLKRRKGGDHQFEASLVPDWRRKGAVEYKTQPLLRGFYHFGDTECSTEDIFGIFEHKGSISLPHGFCVLPQKIQIREWRQLHQMLKGMHHHSTTTRAIRETTQINGVREYNYGDKLSRIHWNATARTGTLKSKEFEKESLPKTIIVLDRNVKNYASREQFELAVSVAASLFDYGFSCDLALGLLSVGRDAAYIEPRLGRRQHNTILSHLIDVEPDGAHSLLQVLNDRNRQLTAGTFVTVISPGSGDTMMPVLAWIEQRQMNPCHMWISPPAKQADPWMKHLQMAGYWGYPVATLQDLPIVLGGRSG